MFVFDTDPPSESHIVSSTEKFMRAFAAWKRGDNKAKITIRSSVDPTKPFVKVTMRDYLGREARDNVFYFSGNPDPKSKEKKEEQT